MSSFAELSIDQGTTFSSIVTLADDVTGASMNLMNTTFSSQLKYSQYTDTISGNIVCTITNADEGELTLSMSAANTANIPADRYFFDVMSKNEVGHVSKVFEGTLTVYPSVTKGA